MNHLAINMFIQEELLIEILKKNPTNYYLYYDADKLHGESRHLSNVFNVFVVMTIFNLMNSRIIDN